MEFREGWKRNTAGWLFSLLLAMDTAHVLRITFLLHFVLYLSPNQKMEFAFGYGRSSAMEGFSVFRGSCFFSFCTKSFLDRNMPRGGIYGVWEDDYPFFCFVYLSRTLVSPFITLYSLVLPVLFSIPLILC